MAVRSALVRCTAVALVVVALVAGCASEDDPTPPKKTPSVTAPTELNFAVYGAQPLIDAYTRIAAMFNLDHLETKVVVHGYATHDEAMAALAKDRGTDREPDVFMTDRDDLTALIDDDVIQPVNELLAEREVDFGDGYTRSGLEAFSADAALQCMPADVSPLVVYYNPRLIELDQIAEPGRTPISQQRGWTLEEFARAALQPRAPGVRGLYVGADLEQIAPFIWSGGGEVVDSTDEPTTLTLSDDASAGALEQLLEVVRDPALTFGQPALRRSSALERFKAGKLGMILGYRDLTPELRNQRGLIFDVMPLPRLGGGATVATMSGLCLSADSDQTDLAADFLTDVTSDESASELAETGYVMPANVDVVNDEAFLQTGEKPLHAQVFAREARGTRLLPSVPQWTLVRRAAARELTQLFYQPVILSLPDRLEAIDEGSTLLFDPDANTPPLTPTPSPTPSD